MKKITFLKKTKESIKNANNIIIISQRKNRLKGKSTLQGIFVIQK